MKVTTVIVAVVALMASLAPQSNAESDLVDRVTSALQGSFSALNTKRSEWLNNYSTINNMTKINSNQLKELLLVSKMAVPFVWYLYVMTVRKQKEFYDTVLNEGPQSLPFHSHAIHPSKMGYHMHFEATLLLEQYEDFQMQILLNSNEIFFLDVKFDESQAVMGHREQNEVIEAVLAGDHFPAITLNEPFRINVQVSDDCIVASMWVTNLNLSLPMPLPEKHIWCTRNYVLGHGLRYSLNIHPIGGHLEQLHGEDEHHHQDHTSQEEQEHESHEEQDHEPQHDSDESHEEDREEHEWKASNIRLVSAVVYNGMIFQ